MEAISAVTAGLNCTVRKRPQTNLLENLPSAKKFVNKKADPRCDKRFATVEGALAACAQNPLCGGVSRDNGLRCGSGARPPLLRFELRAGTPAPSRATASWTCEERMRPAKRLTRDGVGSLEAGFVFIMLGGCSEPDYACNFVRDIALSITSIRKAYGTRAHARPIAVLTDGGVPPSWILGNLGVDVVQPLSLSRGDLDADPRAKKLLAYPQSPFRKTVFLDGDTYMLNSAAEELFRALDRYDLAAAFECCRIKWSDSKKLKFAESAMLKGWEMQTGVMAYRRNEAMGRYWELATATYVRQRQMWEKYTSGEQGAMTEALGEARISYVPLPPAFNFRPFTVFQWLEPFGVSIYHGKDLRSEADPRATILERMKGDWAAGAQKSAAITARAPLPAPAAYYGVEAKVRQRARAFADRLRAPGGRGKGGLGRSWGR